MFPGAQAADTSFPTAIPSRSSVAPRETQPPSPREYPPESSDSGMHTPLHLFLAAQGGGRAWHHAGGEFPTRISEVDAALGLFPAPGKRVNWGTLLSSRTASQVTCSALIWHLSPGPGHLEPAQKALHMASKSHKVLSWRRSQDSMATFVDRETKRRERPPPGSRLQDCEGETGKGRKSRQ